MKEFVFQERGIAYRKNDFLIGRQTLVFIHGLSGSSSAWFPYEKIFSDKYNLLTLDLRGHGKSDKPKKYADYEIEKSAGDVYELLQHLRIETCILVSHSYGALVALELLVAHQGKVSATIFLSPTAFLGKTRWSLPVRTVGRGVALLSRLLPFHPRIHGRVDYSRYLPTSDWDLRRVPRDIYNTGVRVYLYCLVQAYAKNYDLVWKNVRIPTLIMHGTSDSYVPFAHSVQLSKEISNSKLVLLENANHIIVLNNVAEVSNAIEAFLA